MRIFKYTIPFPGGAVRIAKVRRFLSLQEQHGQIVAWFMVDPDSPAIETEFLVFGTGHEVPHPFEHGFFCGTVQMPDGLVWHVFIRE